MELAVEKFKVENEPYYLPVGREVELFQAAYAAKLPVMLKGPTGCGKTRFVEYMAHQMQPSADHRRLSRRFVGDRFGRTISARRRRNRLARRTVDESGSGQARFAISTKSSKREKTRSLSFIR